MLKRDGGMGWAARVTIPLPAKVSVKKNRFYSILCRLAKLQATNDHRDRFVLWDSIVVPA
jgi:hypothetical protein